MALDVKGAFLYAPMAREVYIQLPQEALLPGEEHMVGVLEKAMYGTRDAPLSWQRHLSEHLGRLGFACGKANPCILYHRERDIQLVYHVDDMLLAGDPKQLDWFVRCFSKAFECTMHRLGPDKDEEQEISFLNRRINWDQHGLRYQADPRHVQTILEETGMTQCTGVETPGTRDDAAATDDEEPLQPDAQGKYRRVIAILNYLA